MEGRERARSWSWPTASTLRLHTLVVLGYAVVAVAIFHGAWAHPATRVVGSCCDSAAYVDTFRFTGSAVLSGHDPLYSRLMHAPAGFNVMWQPNVMPLVGLLAIPFEATIGPVATYNLVITLALVTAGWASFLLLRTWVGGVLGPVAGGAFFAFSPVMLGHSLGHPQVTVAALVPLMLLVLADILVTQRRRWWTAGPALGALAAAQLLLGEELLAFTVIAGVVLLAVLAVRYRTAVAARARHAATALATAGGVFAFLAAAPLAEQLTGPERIAGPIRDTSAAGTNLAAVLVPNSNLNELVPQVALTAYHDWFHLRGGPETTAYLGVPLLLVLAAICWARRRDGVVQVTVVTTLVVGVLSLGERLRFGSAHLGPWLPWRLVHGLPLMASLLPTRLDQLVDLGVAVLLAAGLEHVVAWRSLRRRTLAWAVLIVTLVPLIPTFHYPFWRPTVPAFFTTSAVDAIPPGATVLLVPIARGAAGDVAAQVWQAESGLRFAIVGGSIFVPSRTGHNGLPGGAETQLTAPLDRCAERLPACDLSPLPSGAQLADDRVLLRGLGVGAVVLGPMPDEGAALAYLEDVMGGPPRSVGGVFLWLGPRDTVR